MTLDEWNKEAETEIRLWPKYGHLIKTAEQKEADSRFIEKVLPDYPSKRTASAALINLGFHYLYTDIKTAMYRFNQA